MLMVDLTQPGLAHVLAFAIGCHSLAWPGLPTISTLSGRYYSLSVVQSVHICSSHMHRHVQKPSMAWLTHLFWLPPVPMCAMSWLSLSQFIHQASLHTYQQVEHPCLVWPINNPNSGAHQWELQPRRGVLQVSP